MQCIRALWSASKYSVHLPAHSGRHLFLEMKAFLRSNTPDPSGQGRLIEKREKLRAGERPAREKSGVKGERTQLRIVLRTPAR